MGLRDNSRVWKEDKDEVVRILIRYYETIFRSSQPIQIDEVVAHVPQVVSQSIKDILIREFTGVEVEEALKKMASLKALGPDGLPPLFYQRYWLVVGPDVTLIPKVKNLERVTEFCSISFCNVINKLVSKFIANRLKTILPKILSASQSAFVLGRLITHNVLIAFETFHHMHTTKIGRDGAMALKPDMSKAYDRVEWIYLEFIMRKMGFHPRWVSMIMMCISTVSYSLLINGEPMVILIPLVGYAKGILYHYICFCCLQKDFILL